MCGWKRWWVLRGEGRGVGIENGMGHGLERRMDRRFAAYDWLIMAVGASFNK